MLDALQLLSGTWHPDVEYQVRYQVKCEVRSQTRSQKNEVRCEVRDQVQREVRSQMRRVRDLVEYGGGCTDAHVKHTAKSSVSYTPRSKHTPENQKHAEFQGQTCSCECGLDYGVGGVVCGTETECVCDTSCAWAAFH
eukprot:3691643-Rhodomonas_salina.5